ncbi:hypothetical protein ABIC37_005065 [Priestia megaterium]|uniref:hypothetical protein n=1 Tax=Priestia megaterium TaxID=1404 RepID=UPI003392E040
MTSLQSYSELELLNIIISMCTSNKFPNVDNIFFQEGYRIVSIDRSVTTSSGSVKYDLVLSSTIKNLTLCFELKGFKASNISTEQLNRYKGLSTEEYIRLAGIQANDTINHKLQTIIGINLENLLKTEEYQVREGYNFPILSFGSQTISVSFKELNDVEINRKLTKSVSTLGTPLTFIHFDKESRMSDLAHRTIPTIYSYAKVGTSMFTVEQIVNDVYCSVKELHNIIGPDVKKAVVNKIKSLLKQMSKEEFKNYLSWNGKDKCWMISKIHSESHHTTDFAFQKAGRNFIERLDKEIPFKIDKDIPQGQLSLFDEVEVLDIN